MKPGLLIGIFVVILVVAASIIYVFGVQDEQTTPIENPDTGEETGFYSQQLIIHYHDGTKSNDLITGWFYHENKKIDTIMYKLYVTPEHQVTMNMQSYHVEYEVRQDGSVVRSGPLHFTFPSRIGAVGKTLLVQHSFSPFDFINYSYPDGTYELSVVPSGEIIMDNNPVTLPGEFGFTMLMKDERSVNIDFN